MTVGRDYPPRLPGILRTGEQAVKRKYAWILAVVVAGVANSVAGADVPEGEHPITVAVLPFRTSTDGGRYAPLADAIGDLLLARLSAAEGLAFVERTALDKVLKEQGLSVLAEPGTQARVGHAVGARFVLTGSISAAGQQLHITAHLLEVSTTRVARSAKVTARGDDLIDPVDRLARELIGQFDLELPRLTPEQIDNSPEANWHFARGLGYYYAGMHEHAATQFLEALAIDPGHAEARFSHAMNYFDQAEYDHARVEFARFLKRFGDHPRARRAEEMLRRCQTHLPEAAEGGSP